MPFIGLGLHVLVALYFAVHALRSGQDLYWLFILFAFPMLGSIVYFAVIYLPNSRLERGARKAVSAAAKVLDPSRELREARAAYEYASTAKNRMRLAGALLDAGSGQEAADHYEGCLKGAYADDLEIRLGAARAHHASGHHYEAIRHLEVIRRENPQFRAEQVALLLALAHSCAGNAQDAKSEFESAVDRFGSFEIKAEYAIWAIGAGEREIAARLMLEIQRSMERWNRHTREINLPLLRRLDAAYTVANERS